MHYLAEITEEITTYEINAYLYHRRDGQKCLLLCILLLACYPLAKTTIFFCLISNIYMYNFIFCIGK